MVSAAGNLCMKPWHTGKNLTKTFPEASDGGFLPQMIEDTVLHLHSVGSVAKPAG
jgi:hypothetical protein